APPGFACLTAPSLPSPACGGGEGGGASRQAFEHVGRGHKLAAAIGPTFEFDLALRKPLWPDQYLPRNADQVGGGKFGAGPLFEIVVENFDALRTRLAIQVL